MFVALRFVMLTGLLLATPAVGQGGAAVASPEQDLAWLNAQLDREAQARRREANTRRASVDLANIAERIGSPLHIRLKDGRIRSGVLESVDAARLSLRVRLGAGDYLFEVERADLAQISEG